MYIKILFENLCDFLRDDEGECRGVEMSRGSMGWCAAV